MSKDYSMYRFYKGEKENPFDQVKQNAQYQFWGYEELFAMRFNEGDFSSLKWIPPNAFDTKEWETILASKPVNKEELLKLWLFNLIMVHLPEKYESKDDKFLGLYLESEKSGFV